MQVQTKALKELLENGFTVVPNVLSKSSCDQLIALYDDEIYRSVINMKRYNFGCGEYKYYSYPLPKLIRKLRCYFYDNLRPVAEEWATRTNHEGHYPKSHDEYLQICHDHEQHRPTPLILKYGKGDFNTLHQDLYGDIHFPYQAAIMLSDRSDYTGGEFTLVEQRPRMQSVAHVLTPQKGDAIIFAVNEFPKTGKRGYYKAKLRHGVSVVRSGSRYTLGIIMHDAR